MENKVKATVTGVHPETGEIHHMDLEGDAICIITLNDKGEGIAAQDTLMGSLDLNMAMAMVKSLAGASSHLLDHLPPAMSSIIKMDMLREILGKMDNDEQEALKEYDARRAADGLA